MRRLTRKLGISKPIQEARQEYQYARDQHDKAKKVINELKQDKTKNHYAEMIKKALGAM